jgi:mannose-1-phosphate guanylyltransferase/mannose-6-phosphate isomerase
MAQLDCSMAIKIRPVILCGGSGTRLWPLSRKSLPKQFAPILEGKSLLQITLERTCGLFAKDFFLKKNIQLNSVPLCVGSEMHVHQIKEVASSSNIKIDIIAEPFSKNTAAAMTAAAMTTDPDEILIFCPSDHYIPRNDEYLESILYGLHSVEENTIVALGVLPTFPSSAYGYLSTEKAQNNNKFMIVREFIEKPDFKKASKLINEGDVYWNAGSFMSHASTIISSIKKYAPGVFQSVQKSLKKAEIIDDLIILNSEEFNLCPNISIDYAVMEKHKNVRLVQLQTPWSDLGSWNALADLFEKDEQNNRSLGSAHFFESNDSFIYSTNRPVVTLGIKNIVVVETSDVVMVADFNSVEKIKNVVNNLEKINFVQVNDHRKVNRPWGFFDRIDQGDNFQVKKIIVKPGGRLSLQRHKYRAEHWVVVKGKAMVTRGQEIFELTENQSTYIPIGVKHRLENPYNDALEIIEVQTGSYLGEDDIERFDDIYGRDIES